jgi:hypothetical protein
MEESPADSILKTQEKLREYSPSVSRTPLVSKPPELADDLLERSRSLLSCLNNSSTPSLRSHKPPNMKYSESVLGSRTVSNEILEDSPRSLAPTTAPTESADHLPKLSFDQAQEVPALSLEEILSERDIPEEDLVPASTLRFPEEGSDAVSSPLQVSLFEEMKVGEGVSSEDDLLESLLSGGGAARYLPASRPLASESQYQWASTVPLSEAEYEALRSHILSPVFSSLSPSLDLISL